MMIHTHHILINIKIKLFIDIIIGHFLILLNSFIAILFCIMYSVVISFHIRKKIIKVSIIVMKRSSAN